MLTADDQQHLDSLGLKYEVTPEGGMTCVVICDYPLPVGYQPEVVDLLIRLPAGFPDVAPDMWWTDPVVVYAETGQRPPATEHMENHVGRTWQRWSRHFTDGQWRPGRDTLRSHLRLIRNDLENGVERRAA